MEALFWFGNGVSSARRKSTGTGTAKALQIVGVAFMFIGVIHPRGQLTGDEPEKDSQLKDDHGKKYPQIVGAHKEPKGRV